MSEQKCNLICERNKIVKQFVAMFFTSCDCYLLGEYVPKAGDIVDELNNSGGSLADEEPSSLIDLPEFSLEEALQLVGLDEDSTEVS